MIRNPEKQFFKFVRDFTRENTSLVSKFVCKEVSVNLLKEAFTLINQIWAYNANRFDEGLVKKKAVLTTIKAQLAKDGKTVPFNNKELYKRIRESIVHNSKNNPNFAYNLENFELNLGKVNGDDFVVNLDFEQLINLVYVLFNNTKQNTTYATISIGNISNKLTRNSIKDNIKIINEDNGGVKDLDRNQIERIYNYFMYLKTSNAMDEEKEMKAALRFPYNAEPLFVEKLKALTYVSSINSGTTWRELTSKFPELLNPVNALNFYFSVITNLLFTMASTQTNNDLEDMFSGCINGLNKDDIRHLRNSLCHGRYFHDFNNSFYFYDGKKQLEFKLKLTMDNINKVLDKVAKGGYYVTILK